MFPPSNLAPTSTSWVNTVQNALTEAERRQPILDKELALLQKSGNSVIDDVSSSVNAYYTNTLLQYPVYGRSVPMETCLGSSAKTVSISAPAAATSAVAENWVSVFTHNITIPQTKSAAGVRLNNAQFRILGSSTYFLRFRWRVNGSSEGILNNKWMSRHEFNLNEYAMTPTGTAAVITNRYVHWTGAATDTLQVELQASILNGSNYASSVSAQSVVFEPFNGDGLDSYLDVVVTV